MKLVHASLFSGLDAPSLAASWMGWENAFHCEINPFCNTVLRYWFPDSEHYEDITKADFKKWRGKVDILTGGFPCQPFSVAGQRKGADDNRYLWPQMLRAIREIRPTWVIGENVAGILTMVQPGEEIEVGSQTSLFGEDNRKRVLHRQQFVVETICQDLEREGYSVQPLVIPACAVEAPHQRDRVWFVAHRSNTGIEDVRREREDEVLSGGDVADTKSERLQWRAESCYRWESNKEIGRNIFGISEGFSRGKSSSDTDGERCDNRSDNRGERCVYNHQERNAEEDKPKRAERECGTCEDSSTTSDPHSQRFKKHLHEQQSAKSGFRGRFYNEKSHEQPSPYPESQQSERMRLRQSEHSFSEQRELGGEDSRSDSNIERRRYDKRTWKNFPTQPPICRGNDGLPFDVDNLTIPYTTWRTESVKAYGNAIVPQVIFEIYQSIEKIETQITNI